MIVDAIDAQNQYLRSYPKHREYSAYEEFKKANGTIYSPSAEEKAAFQTAAAPVRDYFLKTSGKQGEEWLNRFQSEISACEAQIQADYDIQFK